MNNLSAYLPPIHRIKSLTFSILSDDISEKISTNKISNSNIAPDDSGGLFDPHLGSLSDHK